MFVYQPKKFHLMDLINRTNSSYIPRQTICGETELHVTKAELIIEGCILTVICLMAFVGNLSMWIIILRNKDLRTITNSFLLTLATADLMVSVVNMPVTILTIFHGTWLFSKDTCTIQGFTNMLTLVTSVLSLCNISINRYVMVCKPTKFKDIYTKRSAFLMIFGTVSLATVLSLPPIFGWTDYSYSDLQSVCFSDWSKSLSYAIFMISFCFCCPLFVMLICNILIIKEIRRRNRRVMHRKRIHFKTIVNAVTGTRMTRNRLSTSTLGVSSSGIVSSSTTENSNCNKENISNKFESLEPAGKCASLNSLTIDVKSVHSLKESNQNVVNILDELKENRNRTAASQQEVRLARMLGIVVVVFFCCWSPYCVSMLFTIFGAHILPRSFHMTTLLIGYFNSACNPVIYGVMNKRFGKEFRRLYCAFRR